MPDACYPLVCLLCVGGGFLQGRRLGGLRAVLAVPSVVPILVQHLARCMSGSDRILTFCSLLSVTNYPERSCSLAAGRGAEPSLRCTARELLRAPLSAQLVAVRHHAVAALPNVPSMSFGPSAAMVLVQVRARPALPNDRAAQNHRAGARRSAQSLRVDVHHMEASPL